MKTPAEVAAPASPLVKQNIDNPAGINIKRQPEGTINSPRQSGGYVPPERFTNNQK